MSEDGNGETAISTWPSRLVRIKILSVGSFEHCGSKHIIFIRTSLRDHSGKALLTLTLTLSLLVLGERTVSHSLTATVPYEEGCYSTRKRQRQRERERRRRT
jgi:hypothetical protein